MNNLITDNTGKSKSFFLKKNRKIQKSDILFLKKEGCKIKKSIRICIHPNKKTKLHAMVNFLYKQKNIKKFIHTRTDEIYQIIEGQLKILIYDKKLNVLEKIMLKNKNEIYRLAKNTIHSTESLKEFCIFSEYRLGPFKKSDNKEYFRSKSK
jgi:cupin fold WbuC family metalloprotein